ncbi:MAG: oligosaccharide flippase family protein [Candidatus Aenigmatarchaeota archaeon]
MKFQPFKSELIKRSSLVFIATAFASLIAFFANLIISKLLGPESFGVFKTVIYLFAFLPTIADLGINSSLTKYIAEFGEKSKKLKHLIYWFFKVKLISYVILIAVLFFLKDYIALYFLKDASLSYIIIAGIVFLASNFFLTFSFIVLGFQNFKLYSLSLFLNSSISAILAVLLSQLGIFYMILGWSLGPIIGNLPNIFYFLSKKIEKIEKIEMKKIFFGFSLPIFPIELSVALTSAIIPILSLFFSQELIGYYSFAFMFYYVTMLIPNSLSTALFPKVSELNGLKKHKDAKAILKKSFLYYSLVAIIGLAFVILLSEWFISLIANEYLPSLFIFQSIVSLGFIFGYNVIYSNYLKGLGKVKKYAFFVLLQNIILIAVSFILLSLM